MDHRLVHALVHLATHAGRHLFNKHGSGGESGPPPDPCVRCGKVSAAMYDTACCRARLCDTCATDYTRSTVAYCGLCGAPTAAGRQRRASRPESQPAPAATPPGRPLPYPTLVFLGFVAVGLFLGWAGGSGLFLTESIDRAEQGAVAAGDDVTKPTGMLVGRYLMGRLDRHPVQTAVQDASLPLLGLALVGCLAYFGRKWNKKGLLGALAFLLAWCLIRLTVWLFTLPATLVVPRLADPLTGMLVIGVTYAAWGAAIGLAVRFVRNRRRA